MHSMITATTTSPTDHDDDEDHDDDDDDDVDEDDEDGTLDRDSADLPNMARKYLSASAVMFRLVIPDFHLVACARMGFKCVSFKCCIHMLRSAVHLKPK